MRSILTALAGAALLAAAAPAAAETTVIAEVVAKPESAAVIRAALTRGIASARKEHGFVSYTLFEDREHAGRFMTYETWADDASLDAHLTSPVMKAAIAQLTPMLSQPPVISRLKPL